MSISNVLMRSTVMGAKALAEFAVTRGSSVGFYHMHGDYDENIYVYPFLVENMNEALRSIDDAIEVLVKAGSAYQTSVANQIGQFAS